MDKVEQQYSAQLIAAFIQEKATAANVNVGRELEMARERIDTGSLSTAVSFLSHAASRVIVEGSGHPAAAELEGWWYSLKGW